MRLLVLILLSSTVVLAGGDPKYPVSSIPSELMEGADVVVRQFNMTFTIKDKKTSSLHIYEVYTILNDRGKEYAQKIVPYDKYRKIDSFKGASYDAQGDQIRKLKSNEIYDQSAISGYSLYEDSRLKAADLSYGNYPYTVEFEYEINNKFLYDIPDYVLLDEEHVSVEKSSYTLVYPNSLKPAYKAVQINVEPTITKIDDNTESLSWKFESVRPIKNESFSPPPFEYQSRIYVSPSTFEYMGYPGSMDTWLNFGKWIQTLNEGRGILPEETKSRVKELTRDLATPEEKAQVLYEFLQNKTRYVSIQLGIGGLQPFEATVVDKTGYGDCKALSNYMVAMLREAGVKGYYTLIYGGSNNRSFPTDFTTDQFNHIIVAVPNERDTLWLECTSQTNPFGYLGSFTGDRYGLMITDDGGHLVKTTTYPADQNIQSRTAEVYVDEKGLAKATVQTRYSGLQYENGGLDGLLNDQYDSQKKWIQRHSGIVSFDINSFKFTNQKAKIPTAILDLNVTISRFANVSGKRLFFTPNMMNRSTFIPEKEDNRKLDIVRRIGFVDHDTIKYHIPESIYPEFLPEPVKIISKFGEYENSIKVEQGVVVYIRKLIINKGRYPASTYQEMIDFYKSVNKADNVKLVFANKT